VVVADLAAARRHAAPDAIEGVVLTDTRGPQASFEQLRALLAQDGCEPESVVAPRLLGISTAPSVAAEPAAAT
jgi:hypothetical protein